MRKAWTSLLAFTLVFTLAMGTAAAAKPADTGKKQETQKAEKTSPSSAKESKVKEQKPKAPESTEATKATVSPEQTTTTEPAAKKDKGHKGYKGLLKAIENVKDKPAGAVLANLLLTKYAAQLTPEMAAELEKLKTTKEALTTAADLLAESGNAEEAVAVQEEAIQADVTDLEGYKKLDELEKQAGEDTDGMKLFVNGEEVEGAAPTSQSGSTLVPLRTVAEALKAEVTWNAKDKSVTIVRDDVTVKLYLNNKKAIVNGVAVKLKTPPGVAKGLTRVPMRFISEMLGSEVKWEPVSKSVVIYDEPTQTTEPAQTTETAPTTETTPATETAPTTESTQTTTEPATTTESGTTTAQ